MEKKNRDKDELLLNINKPKQSVSIKGVIFFLAFLFLIFVSFLVYLRYSNFSPLAGIFHPELNWVSKDAPLTLQLKKDTGKVELKIACPDLETVLGLYGDDFPLKNPSCSINTKGVSIKGKLSEKLWSLKVEALMMPRAEEGKLVFEIVSIKAMGVTVPGEIASRVSAPLKEGSKNILPEGISVTEVRPMVGYVLVEGEKNKDNELPE